MKIHAQCIIALLLLTFHARADEPAPATPPKVELNLAEQEFVDLLTGASLVGKFSMNLQPDAIPKTERYAIESVRKIKDTQWVIQANMRVGKAELPVPVPVQVEWAGDTAMIQLTDLTIPLVGEGFTARVLFYGDRYAGIWQHGQIGGHMWGTVEKPMDAATGEKTEPGVPVEKDGPLP